MSDLTKSILDRCLHAVWQRTQRKHLAGGLLAFACWFVPLFFVAVIIDRFTYTPGWLRAYSQGVTAWMPNPAVACGPENRAGINMIEAAATGIR